MLKCNIYICVYSVEPINSLLSLQTLERVKKVLQEELARTGWWFGTSGLQGVSCGCFVVFEFRI